MFTTVDRFIDSLYEEYEGLDVEKIVNRLESIYANEVSFLFYLVIGRGLGKKSSTFFPDTWVRFRFIDILDDSRIEYGLSPSSTLIRVLQKDKDIKTRFSRWINDSMVYQKKVLDIMSDYNNQMFAKNAK